MVWCEFAAVRFSSIHRLDRTGDHHHCALLSLACTRLLLIVPLICWQAFQFGLALALVSLPLIRLRLVLLPLAASFLLRFVLVALTGFLPLLWITFALTLVAALQFGWILLFPLSERLPIASVLFFFLFLSPPFPVSFVDGLPFERRRIRRRFPVQFV